eukprot:SAG22_NODE_3771_length_1532_cov_1.453723_1_plen_105_part_00
MWSLQEGSGPSDYLPPDPAAVDTRLSAGSGRAAEWGRKGVNLVRMGWREPPELMLAELDGFYAAGVYGAVQDSNPFGTLAVALPVSCFLTAVCPGVVVWTTAQP